MSFSGEVKQELAGKVSPARHCQLAELAAILHFCGEFGRDDAGRFCIGLQTENERIVRKCFTLLKKT
ncbi:MAG: DNA-binding protein WhiA, partial [Lachnospiraceae bacterium]|nr:DNA-binding protein WhiA [Lachnospiraceae bacterium]